MALHLASTRAAPLAAASAAGAHSAAPCSCHAVLPRAALRRVAAAVPVAAPCRAARSAARAARRAATASAASRAARVVAAASADVIDVDATVTDLRVPVTVITGYLGCAAAARACAGGAARGRHPRRLRN
jgi:hypothetical protein